MLKYKPDRTRPETAGRSHLRHNIRPHHLWPDHIWIGAMADHRLDITGDVCPMTFVKTKLLLERMRPGETAQIRLTGDEPVTNVPRSVQEHGHEVLACDPEAGGSAVYLLRVRKRS
jgi:tRNA 2-thiouridine synthesizing protein A